MDNFTTSFTIALNQVAEVVPNDDDDDGYKVVGGSSIDLKSLQWELSDLYSDDTNYYFYIRGTNVKETTQFSELFFNHTIPKSNTRYVKFSLIVTDYTFVSDSADAQLVFTYRFLDTERNATDTDLKTRYAVSLDDNDQTGYFNFTSSATIENAGGAKKVDVNVRFSDDDDVGFNPSEENLLWVMYSRWSDTYTLTQDPQFGVVEQEKSKGWIIAVVILGIVVVTAIIAVILHRRRKARYENMP